MERIETLHDGIDLAKRQQSGRGPLRVSIQRAVAQHDCCPLPVDCPRYLDQLRALSDAKYIVLNYADARAPRVAKNRDEPVTEVETKEEKMVKLTCHLEQVGAPLPTVNWTWMKVSAGLAPHLADLRIRMIRNRTASSMDCHLKIGRRYKTDRRPWNSGRTSAAKANTLAISRTGWAPIGGPLNWSSITTTTVLWPS